ncbi:cryptochrome/photolyase family protein [Sporobolomyces koalae]|uniref:cryptochrome/photolyase family protein n=1 Tax=Sporobolomyces koalae TaxID=500713 RepID=UPI00317590F0
MAAAAKRKTPSSESKTPAKRSRKSTSPVKKEEEEEESGSADEGEAVDLKKPFRDERDDIGVLPDLMEETPLAKLYDAIRDLSKTDTKDAKPAKDGIVVYWMRNKDLRIKDNTALSHASAFAQKHDLPLAVLHIFSPEDYKAHDRSPRRIDFQLRQLKYLQGEFAKHDVPLFTFSHDKRKEIPSLLCKKLAEWNAAGIFSNIEYEVDELRRDTEIVKLVKEARKSGNGFAGKAEFLMDLCVVAPGKVVTKQGKPYAVFSPFFRNWAEQVNSDLLSHIGENNADVESNDPSARKHTILKDFFSHEIPTEIEEFELSKEDHETMNKIWPIGDAVNSVLKRFLKTKHREQVFHEAPLYEGAEDAENPKKDSKIGKYTTGRNRVDLDGTSHLSPYLAAGLISRRQCLREVYKLAGTKVLPTERGDGLGMWVQECAGWCDFYIHVLCAWPRVCMNQPFNLKYKDIPWADDPEDKKFKAWTEGKTGYPIVDAAMRALNAQGYMHNRCRMIVAMFLSKDLLLDWRRGEKYFMQKMVDGDLAANNGGWQWSASTGCDPQPYFRVFNPASQSEKSDPSGEYIRHWVPELKNLKGKSIHAPSAAEAKKCGYPLPIVDHSKARVAAIEAFKNV